MKISEIKRFKVIGKNVFLYIYIYCIRDEKKLFYYIFFDKKNKKLFYYIYIYIVFFERINCFLIFLQ